MVPLARRDHEPWKRSQQKMKMRTRNIRCQVLETHSSGNAKWADGFESEAQ